MIPFFSIVIACCDVEQYVRECLDSVLKQTFTEWECLIGVETSKDNTEAIVRGYEVKDSRFRVFTGPRSGSCSASRNTGIDIARGEYVIFLDGDDTIGEESLQRLHDKIMSFPGADLYPCALKMYNDETKDTIELRDNYPLEVEHELTGPEAILLTEKYKGIPCPMLQLTVFRLGFLKGHDLKCVYGLRRQDSEFSPRALYLAKRVIPLHELFYLYRIRPNAVGTGAKGTGHFHKDWAIIIKSLLAFHASVSKESSFRREIGQCWARQWIPWIFYFWFYPENIMSIPRERRVETLKILFSDGFDDFNLLLNASSFTKRFAGFWVRLFVSFSSFRWISELFFRGYFALSKVKNNS